MTEQAKAVVLSSAPWRRGVPWPIVLIEGLVFAGIGIYMLADSDGAQDVVRQLIAAILLVNGLFEIIAGFRAEDSLGARYRVLRGTIGATVGTVITLEPISDYLDDDASRWILGLGFLAYALLGFAVMVLTREQGGMRLGAVIVNVIFLILAIGFFTGDETDDTRLKFLGVVAIILGVLLVLYAIYLYRSEQATTAAPPVTPAGQTQ